MQQKIEETRKLSTELGIPLQLIYSRSGGYMMFPAKLGIPLHPIYDEIELVYKEESNV